MLRWWIANNRFASVSFSGSSKGLLPNQMAMLRDVMRCLKNEMALIHFHHGDWAGAAVEAHHYVMGLSGSTPAGELPRTNGPVVYSHSPDERDAGAAVPQCVGHINRPRRTAYIRNQDMIDESTLLLYASNVGEDMPPIIEFRDPKTGVRWKALKTYVDHWDAWLRARQRPIASIGLSPDPYSLRSN